MAADWADANPRPPRYRSLKPPSEQVYHFRRSYFYIPAVHTASDGTWMNAINIWLSQFPGMTDLASRFEQYRIKEAYMEMTSFQNSSDRGVYGFDHPIFSTQTGPVPLQNSTLLEHEPYYNPLIMWVKDYDDSTMPDPATTTATAKYAYWTGRPDCQVFQFGDEGRMSKRFHVPLYVHSTAIGMDTGVHGSRPVKSPWLDTEGIGATAVKHGCLKCLHIAAPNQPLNIAIRTVVDIEFRGSQ